MYADLLNKLWKPTKETVAPVLFKKKLDKLNPFFAGCHQHDVQVLCGTDAVVRCIMGGKTDPREHLMFKAAGKRGAGRWRFD